MKQSILVRAMEETEGERVKKEWIVKEVRVKQRILVRAMEETERESKEKMGSQRGQGETKHFGKSYGGDTERE